MAIPLYSPLVPTAGLRHDFRPVFHFLYAVRAWAIPARRFQFCSGSRPPIPPAAWLAIFQAFAGPPAHSAGRQFRTGFPPATFRDFTRGAYRDRPPFRAIRRDRIGPGVSAATQHRRQAASGTARSRAFSPCAGFGPDSPGLVRGPAAVRHRRLFPPRYIAHRRSALPAPIPRSISTPTAGHSHQPRQ